MDEKESSIDDTLHYQETLEGHQRAIMGQLTVEEIYKGKTRNGLFGLCSEWDRRSGGGLWHVTLHTDFRHF